jgi:hypothetical protein
VQQRLTVARYITKNQHSQTNRKKNQPHSHALCDAGGDENCMIFSCPSWKMNGSIDWCMQPTSSQKIASWGSS